MKPMTQKIANLHAKITNKIIEQLMTARDTGQKMNWSMPWTGADFLPTNAWTGDAYKGANVFNLWICQEIFNFDCNKWITFKQAQKLSQHLGTPLSLAGQKATGQIFCPFEYEPKNYKPGDPLSISWFPKAVFNLRQVEGVPDHYFNKLEPKEFSHTDAKKFVDNTGAVIKHHPTQAFFSPLEDNIGMPDLNQFNTEEDYFCTIFHELIHWTGHKDRLDRIKVGAGWGTKEYRIEELVAEMGSAFLCGYFNFNADLQHTAYINHYIEALKSDATIVRTAAAAATNAFNYLMDLQPTPLEIAA